MEFVLMQSLWEGGLPWNVIQLRMVLFTPFLATCTVSSSLVFPKYIKIFLSPSSICAIISMKSYADG